MMLAAEEGLSRRLARPSSLTCDKTVHLRAPLLSRLQTKPPMVVKPVVVVVVLVVLVGHT